MPVYSSLSLAYAPLVKTPFKVALPLGGKPYLLGPNGLPVTKIFVFAPVDAYDLITQVVPSLTKAGRSFFCFCDAEPLFSF